MRWRIETWDTNGCLIRSAVFWCHTEKLLRYFLTSSNSQRHFQRQPLPSVPHCARRMGGMDPGRMWCTQTLSPSLPPSLHPSIHPSKSCLDERWQSWETSLRCHQMLPVNELVRNEWHMLHFKTSRSGPQSCISEQPAHTVSYTQCTAALWWWVMQKRMYTPGFRSKFRTWEQKDDLIFLYS